MAAALARWHAQSRLGLRQASFMGWLNKRQERGAKEQLQRVFDDMVARMERVPAYTLREHMGHVDTTYDVMGVGSWMAKATGQAENEDAKQLVRERSILKAMTDAELDGQHKIKAEEKRRIAAGAEVEVEAVNEVLSRWREAQLVHRWVQTQQKKGSPIPATAAGLRDAMGPFLVSRARSGSRRAR